MQQIRTHLEVEAADLSPLMGDKEFAHGIQVAQDHFEEMFEQERPFTEQEIVALILEELSHKAFKSAEDSEVPPLYLLGFTVGVISHGMSLKGGN